MYCNQCGARMEEGQKFCLKCGHRAVRQNVLQMKEISSGGLNKKRFVSADEQKTESIPRFLETDAVSGRDIYISSPRQNVIYRPVSSILPQHSPLDASAGVSKKKNSKTGWLIGLTAVVLAVTVLLFALLGALTNKKRESIYTEYLNRNFLDEIGLYNPNRKYWAAQPEGVFCTTIRNFDKKVGKELLVIYAQKDGEEITYNISVFGYDRKGRNVVDMGTETPFTEPDYTVGDAGESGSRDPLQMEGYLLKEDKHTYIVLEVLTKHASRSSHIRYSYEVTNEKLKEVPELTSADLTDDTFRSDITDQNMLFAYSYDKVETSEGIKSMYSFSDNTDTQSLLG